MSYISEINERLKEEEKGYTRQPYQTYMTTPEWRSVEISGELAAYVGNGNSYFYFPYFKQAWELFSIWGKSCDAAYKNTGNKKYRTSDYMVMDAFISIFTGVEFAIKSVFSNALSLILPKKNNTDFQQHVSELSADYANFIHTIPFYDYGYFSKLKPLWHAFKSSKGKTVTDYLTFAALSGELVAKGCISAPVSYFFNQPENADDTEISILVKQSKDKTTQTLDSNSEVKTMKVCDVDQKQVDNYKYTYYRCPRYGKFTELLNNLAAEVANREDFALGFIAGQDNIQVKLKLEQDQDIDLDKEYLNLLYEYTGFTAEGQNCKFKILNCKVENILDFMGTIKDNNMEEQIYVHDF